MSSILVIPSIDIKDGKTVRVVKGIPELNCKNYGDDPVEMAMIWRAENAKCIHVVDFNNSHSHSHKNFQLIGEICESVIIPVEMGGGISNINDAKEALDLGIFRLVIGSLIIDNEKEFVKILDQFGPKKIAAAIDVRDNKIVIHGRSHITDLTPIDYSRHLKEIGVERLIVTDINRNGTMEGPNLKLSKNIAEETGLKITHSGGISGYSDLKKVQEASIFGIDSVIIGRALYENKFPCQKIWRVAEQGLFN
ncbi:MAG: 1-(5-phosphoribosyl)-5-[(5-phosphoribosylamino)methylideneamino] imidazole-4-carboxamide isomerase [Melioribacteraceae bacterium]|nr:1-(5-phosphoribosyl)-5-[(5-phosphoribosylamino)methylideneamino] imidazole-4-carboxamide isomerase [Melioribacteraceae bacterium]